MKRLVIYIFIISIISFFTFCEKNEIDKSELISYVNDSKNGLTQEQTSNEVSYKIIYRPSDLIIAQELKTNSNYRLDSLKEIYKNTMYFVLAISRDSSEIFSTQTSDFFELLKTISFELKTNLTLHDNEANADYYLKDFVYPRLYSTTNSTNILLCFNDSKFSKIKDFTIYVNDFVNKTDDKLKFNFSIKDIQKIPNLNFSKI